MGSPLRASGRMDEDMDWGWRQEDDGYIGESGRAVSKVDTAYGRASRLRPDTRERGRVASRTVTDRKPMLTEVSYIILPFITSQAIIFVDVIQ